MSPVQLQSVERDIRNEALNERANCCVHICHSFWESPDPEVTSARSILKVVYLGYGHLELVLKILYAVLVIVVSRCDSIISMRDPKAWSSTLMSPVILAAVWDSPMLNMSENLENMSSTLVGSSGWRVCWASLNCGSMELSSIGDNRKSSIVCPIKDSMDRGCRGGSPYLVDTLWCSWDRAEVQEIRGLCYVHSYPDYLVQEAGSRPPSWIPEENP